MAEEQTNEGFKGMGLNARFGGEPTEPVNTEAQEATDTAADNQTGTETQETATEAAEQTQTQDTESPFFETMNKKFSTQFKSDEDITSLLASQKKLSDYAEKEKAWGKYEVEKQTFQEKIKDLEDKQNPMAYFSSESAYIAEQLRRQRPDLNPVILQEIVGSNIKDMPNFAALVKAELLENPELNQGDVEAVLRDKYNIEEGVAPEEWDGLTKTKIAMDAKAAKAKFVELQHSIEIPKVKTPEDIQAEVATMRTNKEKEIEPYLEQFGKFDKFTREIKEGSTFEFDVPAEFKENLDDMFKGFFIEGNLPVNEENLAMVVELRDALLLYRNFGKIHEVIEKAALSKHQETTDELLNNTEPENTATKHTPTKEREGLPGRGIDGFLNG